MQFSCAISEHPILHVSRRGPAVAQEQQRGFHRKFIPSNWQCTPAKVHFQNVNFVRGYKSHLVSPEILYVLVPPMVGACNDNQFSHSLRADHPVTLERAQPRRNVWSTIFLVTHSREFTFRIFVDFRVFTIGNSSNSCVDVWYFRHCICNTLRSTALIAVANLNVQHSFADIRLGYGLRLLYVVHHVEYRLELWA